MQRSFWSHQYFVVLVNPVSCRSYKFIGLCLFLNMKKIFGGMWRKGIYMRGDGSMGWAANWGSSRVSPSHHFLQCDNGANIPLTKYNDAHAPIESRGWSIFREEDSPGGAPLKLMGYQVRRRVVISRMSGGGTLDIGDIGVARTGYRGRSCRLSVVSSRHQQGPEAGGQGSFQPFKVWGLPYLPHVDISHGPWWIQYNPFSQNLRKKQNHFFYWLNKLSLFCKDSSILSRLQWWSIFLTNALFCNHHAIRMIHCSTSTV